MPADAPGLTVLTSVCDRTPHLAGVLSLDGRVLHANARACAVIGGDVASVAGRQVWDTAWWAHSAEARATLRDAVERAWRGGVEFTGSHRDASGQIREIDFTLTPVPDETGDVGYLLLDGRDVTATQDDLARVNRRLRMLSDCNQALIRATDERLLLEAICRLVVEGGGYRMAWVGYADDDPGRAVRPAAHAGAEDGYLSAVSVSWDDGPTGRGPVGTSIRTGRPCPIQNITHDERFAPWMDEAMRRGYAAMCALPLTAADRTFGALAVYSDEPDAFDATEVTLLAELAADLAFGITTVRQRQQHAQAELALRENEERFRRLVSNSHDIIAVVDANARLAYVSGAVEAIVGYRAEALVGQDCFSMIHPDDADDTRRAFVAAVQQSFGAQRFEHRLRRRDGSWVWVEAVGNNLLGDAVVRGIVLNIRDISDRKRADEERGVLQNQLQQAMKMEAVGHLAGGIAHDFNNLLTAIKGNLELAHLDLNPADPLIHFVDQASRAAASAASLTRQLLSFSRRQIIEPRVLSLNELVGNLQTMLVRLLGENIEQTFSLAPDLGPVLVDPGQFEQVLVNLAVNARDAMPHGGRLAVETANVELGDDYRAEHAYTVPGPFIMLSVSDTGHGMTDEVKERIFEPFFTTKPLGHGTGLGLASIFGAVKQAGGTIEVYSEVDRGTAFKIYLPRASAPAERLVKPAEQVAMPRGRETILVVEDDANVRYVAVSFLKRLGYTVHCAANGDAGLREADKTRVDLLLTDVVLPGINGQELATRLHARHPGVKVIFTSGYTENTIVYHGVQHGRADFIGKPYSIRALATKIREVLDRPALAADAPEASCAS